MTTGLPSATTSLKQISPDPRAVTRLTGDCLVAAAFLSYAGPFPREYRDRLVRETLIGGAERAGVPLTPKFKPAGFLVDEAEAGEWAARRYEEPDVIERALARQRGAGAEMAGDAAERFADHVEHLMGRG